MIFQDAYASLDPRMSVGRSLIEPMLAAGIRLIGGWQEAASTLLDQVGLGKYLIDRKPHQLSGGQLQRVAIARAISSRPRLIVADEAVSALDVSAQAQVLNLLKDLQATLGLTFVFISHDLSVVRFMSQRVAVMYLGKVVELGDTDDVWRRPLHPYTTALHSAVLLPEPSAARHAPRLVLSGEVASALSVGPGCRFASRCPIAQPVCVTSEPGLDLHSGGHRAACHFAGSMAQRMTRAGSPS
jgi:oligopeptide/dipeptide ABC transporter ATP-binding protein